MFGNVIEERGLLDSSLATIYDADGRKLEFDIREDDLQNEKLEEVIELLIAAGYFRARIKGVSAFDKVVGGMVWCVSFCDYDVSIDLLFQENSSIGQKIALTEKVVAVIAEMQCPFVLEPHQIQGLDFIHIFPVVQWLVRKSVEARKATGDAVQSYANYQFEQQCSRSEKVASTSRIGFATTALFDPERIYKRSNEERVLSEVERTRSTLLEYEGPPIKLADPSSSTSSTQNASAKTALFKSRQHCEEPEVTLPTALVKAEATSPTSIESVIAVAVGDEHLKASADYSSDTAAIVKPTTSLSTCVASKARQDETQSDDILKSLTEVKAMLEAELSDKRHHLSVQIAHLNRLKDREIEIVDQQQAFDTAERSVEPKKLEYLKDLLENRDEVKKMESYFKDRCKDEAAILELEKEKLSNKPVVNGSDEEYVSHLMKKLGELSKNLVESRRKVTNVNVQIANVRRKIDDIPSRLELNQYQRRFVELYNEIASLQKEAKKFYILYNTLCDVKLYMEKENGLLDSVYDAYERGLFTDQIKLQFVRQLEQTFDTIKQMKLRVQKRCTDQTLKRDSMKEAYQELLDRQRFYYKVVSDFREECKKNEMLRCSLEESDAAASDIN